MNYLFSPVTVLSYNSSYCQVCDLWFDSSAEVDVHIENVHNPFKCAKCERGFKLRKRRDNHSKDCTGPKHKCAFPECEAAFKYEVELKAHVEYEHDALPCPYCDESAALTSRQLESHINKEHRCGTCKFEGARAAQAKHVCLRGVRETLPLTETGTCSVWKPIARAREELGRPADLNLIRGYVSCGKCGWTLWNPAEGRVKWIEFDQPFAKYEDAERAVPLYNIYRGMIAVSK